MISGQGPIIPPPHIWLETSAKYEGWGKAEFVDPRGVVEGPAVVRVDQRGKATVTIDVCNPPAHGIFFYIKGAVSAANFRRYGMSNPCASVTVKTQEGLFTATERIFWEGGATRSKPHRIRLRPLRSLYEAIAPAEPTYWVLPLSNFILVHWPRPTQDLGAHPLRVFPRTSDTKAGASAEAHMQTEGLIDRSDRLVVFRLNGQPGFIEPLPTYNRLAERLQKGRIANAITSIMVGPAHVPSVEFSDYEGLFPLDMVALLTLSTGTRVGAPWIEFRASDGQLVRRVHIHFGAPAYEHGHAALCEMTPGALGELLTCAFSSTERGKPYLRAAMNQAIDSSIRHQTIESRFVNLVRALETLCRYHGLSKQDLMVNLDGRQQPAVQQALSDAVSKITGLYRAETDPVRSRTLERIASRVANAAQRENDFGLAVAELLRHFGFPDADVLQPHLATHPVAGITNWPGLVSLLRGSVAHEAYFDLESGRHSLDEVLTVIDHVQDLLFRVLFKTLGYNGSYQPPIPPLPREAPVAWVIPTTPPAMLGYH
jgi:hypothetical protein